MRRGHYIWNRAERVDPSIMPQVVLESFDKWQQRFDERVRTRK